MKGRQQKPSFFVLEGYTLTLQSKHIKKSKDRIKNIIILQYDDEVIDFIFNQWYHESINYRRGYTVITIYVKLIKNTRNGRLEVFRTTKPHYLPQGFELVKDLESFDFGVPDKPVEPPKPVKKSWWKRLFELD